MTSLRLALKQSLEESSGGFSPPSLGSDNHNPAAHNPNPNAPPSPNGHGSVTRAAVSSPIVGTGTSNSLSVPQHASVTVTNSTLPSQSPQPWKKRGPGRPRKGPMEGTGSLKKRGRPRKHPVSDEHQENDDPSSSENEFSGEERNDEGEDEGSKDTANEDLKHLKPLKKKKFLGNATQGPSTAKEKETNSELGEVSDTKSALSGRNGENFTRKEQQPTSKEGNNSSTVTKENENDEGRIATMKGNTVPPPHPRVLAWTRTLPVKEARQNVKQGIRVKVRFALKPKKEGKRKKKWYGGLVSQVSKAGSKIRIKYDDGTSEVSRFPDKDVIVDATSNGEHQCSSEFFDPPEEGTAEAEQFRKETEKPQTEASEEKKATTNTQKINETEPGQNSGETENKIRLVSDESSSTPKEPGTGVGNSKPQIINTGNNNQSSEVQEGANAEDSTKPKRKRGRPPKLRAQHQETGSSSGQPSEHPTPSQPTVSPAPTVDSADALVDTPVQQRAHRTRDVVIEPMEVEDSSAMKLSSDAAVPEETEPAKEKPTPRMLSIRIPPKMKASLDASNVTAKPIPTKPDKSPRPGVSSSEARKDQEGHPVPKRIHISLSGSRAAVAKEPKESSEAQDNQHHHHHHNTRGRTTPVPTGQKTTDEELKSPSSPRSKKMKRKRDQRVDSSPSQNNTRSPKPSEESGDKFASVGSAFEKSTSGAVSSQTQTEEEENKALTPKGRPGKTETARSAKRAAAKEASERMSSKQEEQPSKKKKKRDRRRDSEGGGAGGGDESEHEDNIPGSPPWVQCDKCKKWRIIPSDVVGSLPERWFCENNVWDPKRANCDAPQQKDKQLVREKKRRKRQKLMEKAASSVSESKNTSDPQAGAVSDESNEPENSATSRSQDDAEDSTKRPRRASPTDNSDSSTNNDGKTDKKSNSKKMKTNPEPVEIPEEDNSNTDLKPRGRGRPRRNNMVKEENPSASIDPTPDEGENLEWVQCEKCDKWRKLPPEISADELPEVWYCSMNTWNPASANCSAPEDKAEAGLTDIFNNGVGNGKLSYRNLIFGNGRKFNRPISERTRAAESLFAAVSEDTDAPPAVMYANSSAFICRSKLNQPEEPDGLSVLDLMSRSNLWKELHSIASDWSMGLCPFDRLTHDIKESLRDLILQSLGSRTMSGEEVANDIQHRNWQNVPLGWAAAQPHCTVNTITMTMCELVKEGVLECMREFDGKTSDSFILMYRRAKSHSQAVLKRTSSDGEMDNSARCMKFAKPWKSTDQEGED